VQHPIRNTEQEWSLDIRKYVGPFCFSFTLAAVSLIIMIISTIFIDTWFNSECRVICLSENEVLMKIFDSRADEIMKSANNYITTKLLFILFY
jgi:hypothetical protein